MNVEWDGNAVRELALRMREHNGDFTDVEVKRGGKGTPALAQTLCAFGNMPEGGVIIVGIDESTGFEITGVSDPSAVEQAIAAQARGAVSPPVAVEFSTLSIDGKIVVVTQVQGLSPHLRPCKTGGRAYLRQADGDYAMSAAEEQQFLILRTRPRNDAVPVEGTGVGDLDENLVKSYVAASRASSRRLKGEDDETVLRRRGIIEPDGDRLTLAGLYAMGVYPQQFAPSLAVTAAVVNAEGSENRLDDLVHLDGPIPDLLETSMDWVRRNLRVGVRVGEDGNNYDHPELPFPAIRELIANALVHRDLSSPAQSKRVEIRLLPDRLVISSPGGLWGVSREQLGNAAAKSAVNEYLYSICSFLTTPRGARVIEGEGGGIFEVQRLLRSWHADPPIFVDKGVSFSAVLMRSTPARLAPMQSNEISQLEPQEQIEDLLASGPLTRTELTEQTGLTQSQVRYAITQLISKGRVVMNGASGSRSTTYSLPS